MLFAKSMLLYSLKLRSTIGLHFDECYTTASAEYFAFYGFPVSLLDFVSGVSLSHWSRRSLRILPPLVVFSDSRLAIIMKSIHFMRIPNLSLWLYFNSVPTISSLNYNTYKAHDQRRKYT